MATLRQVLNHFEQQSGAISLNAMARELGVERPMLQEMIDYWVRKGRLREANSGTSCSGACSTSSNCAHGCPFVFELPRAYELVPKDQKPKAVSVPCPHCGSH